jgi:hypothetical protein
MYGAPRTAVMEQLKKARKIYVYIDLKQGHSQIVIHQQFWLPSV